MCKPQFLLKTIPHLLEQAPGSDLWTFGKCSFVQTTQKFYNENNFVSGLLASSILSACGFT